MEGATSMVTSAMAHVTEIFGAAVTMVTGNELAMTFFGIMLAGAGIGLFRRAIGK